MSDDAQRSPRGEGDEMPAEDVLSGLRRLCEPTGGDPAETLAAIRQMLPIVLADNERLRKTLRDVRHQLGNNDMNACLSVLDRLSVGDDADAEQQVIETIDMIDHALGDAP